VTVKVALPLFWAQFAGAIIGSLIAGDASKTTVVLKLVIQPLASVRVTV
jgi:hypothetical protein